MTLATWKAEFYPVEASDVSAEDAAAHSLRKWEGLLPDALNRHGVWIWGIYVVECVPPCTSAVQIDSESCALCELYWEGPADAPCVTCPLAIARGGVSCNSFRQDEGSYSPWKRWYRDKDPVPMIHWLRVTVEQTAKKTEGSAT
jgi:hypothetical protein